VAARRAIIGGWKVGDLAFCHEDNGEELDELTIVDGLGLVDFSVDVHAAQWGNLARAITAVATGGVERAVALDESTVLIVDGSQGQGDASQEVRGAGQAWWVEPAEGGVAVRTAREPQTA
jgi:cyanophycinase